MNTLHLDARLSVAPMMKWTDRHCRYFLRLLSPHVLLYTEMITTGALLHGNAARFLAYNAEEHPLALQLGGADPQALAKCAKMAEDAGYDEVNLNVGCPSDRVQQGRFGACLMKEATLVAECVAAMRGVVNIPVTVKTRIGVDEYDSREFLHNFIATVAAAGCERFIMHARKAWLQGLSPKQNRDIPPLCYERVQALQGAFPSVSFILNGGLQSSEQVLMQLQHFPGVMLGRIAYHDPYILAELEQSVFGGKSIAREAVVAAMLPYLAAQEAQGVPLSSMTRHLMGLFKGQVFGKAWRRSLSMSPASVYELCR